MAAVVPTNITTAIAAGGVVPLSYGEGGLIMEVWASLGGAAADTVTIVPTIVADIRTVVTSGLNAGHALSTSAGNTQVVFTMGTGNQAASTYHYHIIGKRRS